MINNSDEMVGQKLDGRYELIEKLCHGSIGDVYRGYDHEKSMAVAIKIATPQLSGNPLTIRRFQRSLEINQYLQHPNICPILGKGWVEGSQQIYAVLKFIEAPTLKALVEKEGPLSPDRFCNIFSALCDAIDYAHSHEKGVVHRDLTPANFLIAKVDGEEQPIIIDFYSASAINEPEIEKRLSMMGELFGTPAYMSPEHCMGHKINQSSDVYSIGCCMFYALSGQPPFIGQSKVDSMQMHISKLPPKDKIPAAFEPLVFKALEKKPEDRFNSMSELKASILKMRPHQNDKKLGFSASRPIK